MTEGTARPGKGNCYGGQTGCSHD